MIAPRRRSAASLRANRGELSVVNLIKGLRMQGARVILLRRPMHSVPVPINVRCYSNSDMIVRRSEITNRRHRGDLFDDLVGHCENFRWQIKAERFRGSKIDHEHEFGCLHHWHISGPLALQNAAGVHPSLAISIANVRAIAH